MRRYFLGGDIGSTKIHTLIADEFGNGVGFGQGGPGNHEGVGYDGMTRNLKSAIDMALEDAGLDLTSISAAGFGVAGYDWPSEREKTLQAIRAAGISAPIDAANDANPGILAGSEEGWGIAIVSGTGCNCRGWDKSRKREGMVTGAGLGIGEGAGASELMFKTAWALSHAWSRRGPATQLSSAFVEHVGARDLSDLIEGLTQGTYDLDASAAPLVFEVAAAGDQVAVDVIQWAGRELGELGKAVIRQLEFEDLEFDVVMVGSMFNGGPLLIDPMQDTIHALAPGARFVRLEAPPVVGALLLGMDLILPRKPGVRQQLITYFKD